MKVSRENNNSHVVSIFTMTKNLEHVSQLRNSQCLLGIRHTDIQTKISEKVGARLPPLSTMQPTQSQSSFMEIGGK